MKSTWSQKFIIIFSSILLMLAVLEISVRIYERRYWDCSIFSTENLFQKKFRLSNNAGASIWDSELGWVPTMALSGAKNIYRTRVHILENGIRSNGAISQHLKGKDSDAILAVGDSYTYGDEVSDEETWPAFLEESMNWKVYNAGVCGYGMDQMLLRAEKLIDQYKPTVLIFGFIGLCISRNEWAAYPDINYCPKPYFEVDGKRLILRNSPVSQVSTGLHLDRMHQILGHSWLIYHLARRFENHFCNNWFKRTPIVSNLQNGVTIGCLIMERLKEISIQKNLRIIVLAEFTQAWSSDDEMDKVLRCAQANQLETLDVRPIINRLKQEDEKIYKKLFLLGHMSPEGNRLIARELKKALLSSYRN